MIKIRGMFGRTNLAICAVLILSLAACKKNKKEVTAPVIVVPPVPVAPTRIQLTLDSIYLYAQQVYLWNDVLPTYDVFNPRKYTTLGTDLLNYNAELYAISQLKINPLTSQPYEKTSSTTSAKYSYIFDSANQNPTAFVLDAKSSVDLLGNGNDYGIKVGAYGSNSAYKIVLQAVYPSSPAQKAGLTRGTTINVINGQSYGTNFPGESSTMNAALFNSSTVTIGGNKKDGTPFSGLVLNKAVYSSNPILKDTVLIEGSKKIGYLVFARFSNSTNAQGVLTTAFNKFATAGITNLVVDLRYNGGGYVSTAEYLTNLIAPSALTGKLMFKELYNSLMQSGQASILANQPLLDANNKVQFQNGKMVTYANIDYSAAGNMHNFSKKGSLEGISNVVFIVSGNTASASELVINSLKPHITVKLVGTTTYGKPVGFFPIRIENKYDVYYSLFQTQNSLSQGEYFPGFTPDATDPNDDAFHDFGDREENYLKKSIGFIVNNLFAVSSDKAITVNGERVSLKALPMMADEQEFKGMIENRFKLKQ